MTMQPPQPKGSGWKWWALYFIAGTIDGIQLLIGWTGIGTLLSEGLELFMPIFLAGALLLMKISLFQYPLRLVSIFGITGLDAVTGGIAPFWVLDVWYLQHSVKKEDQLNDSTYTEGQPQTSKPLIQDGMRRPTPPPLPESSRNQNTRPLVNDGIRAPQK